MAETTTINFNWRMPDPGGSANTWGATLNATTQAIDAQVWANQQGLVPIGSIAMFGGATGPTNWLICDGSSLSTSAPNDKLFAIIGYTYGGSGANFNLPNLVGRFPIGANGAVGLAGTGGEASHALLSSEMPAHAHPIEQTPHTHGVTGAAHSHTIGDLVHSHTVNEVFGGGGEIASGSGWGQHNVPSAGSTTGITTTASATPAIVVSGAYANINGNSTDSTGGGAAHNNLPPYLQINFIIRYK